MTITHYLGNWAQLPVVCNFVINEIMNRGLINCIQFALSACCHIVTMSCLYVGSFEVNRTITYSEPVNFIGRVHELYGKERSSNTR